MTRRPAPKLVLAVLAVPLAIAIFWQALFSDPTDPRSPGYVLWKAGLHHLDNAVAGAGMIHDGNRDGLVVGRSYDDLTNRFGALLAPEDMPAYFQNFARTAGKGRKVRFIAHTAWMIVFDARDRGAELYLVKG